jgi:hypothetical protein
LSINNSNIRPDRNGVRCGDHPKTSKVTVQLGAKKPGFSTPGRPSSYEKLRLASTHRLVDG